MNTNLGVVMVRNSAREGRPPTAWRPLFKNDVRITEDSFKGFVEGMCLTPCPGHAWCWVDEGGVEYRFERRRR